MTKGRKYFLMASVFLAILGITACGSGGSEQKELASSAKEEPVYETLNIGTLASFIGAPAYYAYEKGYFEEEGLNVNLSVFDSGAPINEALAAGELDIGQSGFASIYAMTSDVCSWIMEVDNAINITCLFANPDIPAVGVKNEQGIYGSAETLKGTKAIINIGTTSQFMVEKYASMFGLSDGDITQINLENSAQYQAFKSGEADFMTSFNTLRYQLEDEGYVNMGNFYDIVGLNLYDGVIVRNDVLESRREEAVLYVKCIQRALDELGNDPELRFEYLKSFYEARGKDIEDDILRRMSDDFIYQTSEIISSEEYVLGYGWPEMSDFLLDKGKIEEDGRKNMEKNIDASILCDATGMQIRSVNN